MTNTKERYKNSDNIEEVYIQLRFPKHCGSGMEISKLEQHKNLWCKKKNFFSKKWFIRSLTVFNVID